VEAAENFRGGRREYAGIPLLLEPALC